MITFPSSVPAPVLEWPLARECGTELRMLRLDLLHPVVSGNKWLKLQGWLEQMPAQAKGIATYAGAWSNHAHAMAYYCHAHGLQCRIYIRQSALRPTAMLQDARHWGATVIPVSQEMATDSSAMAADAAAQDCYWVPMGGDGEPGLLGVQQFFASIDLAPPDAVWLAAGTGTTAAGIATTDRWQQVPINALLPGLGKISTKMVQDTWRHISNLHWHHSPAPRFGQTNPSLLDTMQQWFDSTGVPTDLVYTGRLISHLNKLLQEGHLKGQRLLLIHTGGLQGNRSLVENPLKF